MAAHLGRSDRTTIESAMPERIRWSATAVPHPCWRWVGGQIVDCAFDVTAGENAVVGADRLRNVRRTPG